MSLSVSNALVLSIYVLTFVVGLPANLLALKAFVGRVRQPRPAPVHILLLSLTLADLLLLLLLPFKMVEEASGQLWILPEYMCAITGFGFYSSIYMSTWLLAGISVERYLGVAYPVRYKMARRPAHGVAAAFVAWLLSFGHCTLVVIVQYLPEDGCKFEKEVCPTVLQNGLAATSCSASSNKPTFCSDVNTFTSNLTIAANCSFNASVTVAARLKALAQELRDTCSESIVVEVASKLDDCAQLTGTCPQSIFCYENFTEQQLKVVLRVRLELFLVLFCLPLVVTVFCYWRFVQLMLAQTQVGAPRRWRAVGLAVVTLFNFLVCFGPYNVSHVVGFHTGRSPTWRVYALLLSTLNASFDPLLFYFSSAVVRRAFGDGLRALRRRGASLLGRAMPQPPQPPAVSLGPSEDTSTT